MKITEILKQQKTTISFEFFPPKTEKGWINLFHNIKDLLPLKPGYVSVTYGAGGSTRSRTHELVARLCRETELGVVAHLTCINSTRNEISRILDEYEEAGVTNILALRGDVPQGDSALSHQDFPFASDLVEFIRKRKPDFGIGVAGFPEGHPATPNRLLEIDFMKAKVDAGADYVVTQLFFDNRDYYDYRERCQLAGMNIPIIAGIMPITSLKNLQRMAELSPGTRFPASLLKTVYRAEEDNYVKAAGLHWATEQVRDLIDNDVPGIHFYTLNHSESSVQICHNLGLKDYGQLNF